MIKDKIHFDKEHHQNIAKDFKQPIQILIA